MNRRHILRLGMSGLVAAITSPFVLAQPSPANSASAAGVSPVAPVKLDGTVTYNAGWVVPLEDRAPLLDLESKKTKEQEELAKKGVKTGEASAPKDKKSFADRFQEVVGKVKNFF